MYLLSEYEISNNGDGSTTVISLCATPTFIAAGLENGWIHVENVDGGRSTALDSHQGPVWALAATSGPEILVSGASDGLVKIWNIASGYETSCRQRGVLTAR
jgi:WD40 repeat protein